jgi:ParB-like chromosome segregation protein Spo0J
MGYREPKPLTPTAAAGVKGIVAARARSRRESQRALSEINLHSPRPRRNDLAPRLRLETRTLESLRPASRSVRCRDVKQSAKLQASLERFGLCRPILIDAEGTIVEGHGLWEVARAQGVSEVPCIVIDHLDRTELRALRIALNRLGETGAWDPVALRLEFEELTVLGLDLVETGFETAEIDGIMLLNDEEDLAAGEAPAPRRLETAISRLGDIWLLGDHRLANGDARDAALYERLMPSGEFAQLVLTDEPYNVANVGHVTSNANRANSSRLISPWANANSRWSVAQAERNPDSQAGNGRADPPRQVDGCCRCHLRDEPPLLGDDQNLRRMLPRPRERDRRQVSSLPAGGAPPPAR